MECPKCKKESVCFCKNCKSRRKYPRVRSEKAKHDLCQCPYCRTWFTFDYLEDVCYNPKDYETKKFNQS